MGNPKIISRPALGSKSSTGGGAGGGTGTATAGYDRYIGTLGLADDLIRTSSLPHHLDFPAGTRNDWLLAVSDTVLPSGRLIQDTEEYFCIVDKTVAGKSTAWECRGPQIIKQNWVSRFVKPINNYLPNNFYYVSFLSDNISGGNPAYFDLLSIDITSWLPSFEDSKYMATFDISLSIVWAEEPSGQEQTAMYASIHERPDPYVPGKLGADQRLITGIPIYDAEDKPIEQFFGTFNQPSTVKGFTTSFFSRLDFADNYYSDFQTIVHTRIMHTAETPRSIIGGALGFSCIWRKVNA